MTVFYRTDRWGNQLGVLQNVSSATRDRTTSGTDEVTIVCTTQCDKGDRIIFTDSHDTVREYIVNDLEFDRSDSLTMTYTLVNSVTELSLYFIEDRRVRGGNALTALTRCLEGTRWQVGDVDPSTEEDISYYHQSALQSLEDLCDEYGLEYETEITLDSTGSTVASRAISLTTHMGSTNTRRFDFGRNLSGLKRTVETDDVITRLYPYGNGIATTDEDDEETGGYSRKITIEDVNEGIPYIEDEEATQLWGVPGEDGEILPAMGTEDFDTDDPEELLELAKAALPSLTEPTITYTATVAVLGIEGVDRQGIGLGDDVYIRDSSFPTPVTISGRVLEIQDDLLNPLSEDTTITLGNLTETLTSSTNSISSTVASMASSASAWDAAATASGSYVDAVVGVMNQIMNQTGGYVYFIENEGIFVYDAPVDENPTMVIQIGGGYFRIASSKDSDGNWEWRTMGTGEGLIADTIVAGTIYGTRCHWDLDNGVFQMYDSQGNMTVYLDGSGQDNTITGAFRTRYAGSTDNYIYIPYSWSSYTSGDQSFYGSGLRFVDGSLARSQSPQIASQMQSSTLGTVSGIYMNSGYPTDNYPGSGMTLRSYPQSAGATGRSNWRSFGRISASTDWSASIAEAGNTSEGRVLVQGIGGTGGRAYLEAEGDGGSQRTYVNATNTGGSAQVRITSDASSTSSDVIIQATGVTGSSVELTAQRSSSSSVCTGMIASTDSGLPRVSFGGYLGAITSNATFRTYSTGSNYTCNAGATFTFTLSVTANAYGTFRWLGTARGSGYVTCNVGSQSSSGCQMIMYNVSDSGRTVGVILMGYATDGDNS